MRIFLSILAFFWVTMLIAQEKKTSTSYSLEIRFLDKNSKFSKKKNIKTSYLLADSLSISKQISKTLKKLHQNSFIAASVDTIIKKDKQTVAFFMVGNPYHWANLANGNINLDYLSAIGFRERLYIQQPFYYKEVVQIQGKLLDYLENNGYPFAQVYLDSILIDSSTISARIYYQKGPLITFEALEIEGKKQTKNQKKSKKKVRITKGFLASYLGIKEGKLYNEKTIKKIQKRLINLRYLTSWQTPYVLFRENKAAVNLFLTNKPSSKIDVLFGLLPKQDPLTQQQTFDFTGNIHIDLVNPLGTGKHIMFRWQQIKAGTSDLVLRLEWPYVLQMPLGADLSFKLYKRDSTFLDIIGDIGVQYLFNGNSYIKAFWKPITTNLININTTNILATQRLPNTLDLQTNTFGIELYINTLDYKYNPRSGFESKLVAEFMLKNIRKNNAILDLKDSNNPSFNFASLYDSLTLNSFQYRFSWQHSHFVRLWKSSTLMAKIEGGLIVSQNDIYSNELFRLGGNKRLRGFDEESILATFYNVFTIEWRFLFGKNSYAYVFGDGAYMQNKSVNTSYSDWPVGFGVGIALETKVGVFGLSYALGSQLGNPILLQNSKLHFGYVYAF